jgi:hypothetical protein
MTDIKIEDGFYTGKMIGVMMGELGNGNPLLIMDWELMDEGLQGHVVQSEMHFTGGAKSITVQAMIACGWKETEDLLCMLGSVKQLLAKTTPKYGQQWSPWVKNNKPMDASKARSFLASLSTKTTSSPFAGRQPGDEDDVPFG